MARPYPSASSSTSLESHVSVTPRPTKKHRIEDEDDPTYQPRDDEVESAWSPNPEQMPVVPRELNFEEEQVRDKEPPRSISNHFRQVEGSEDIAKKGGTREAPEGNPRRSPCDP